MNAHTKSDFCSNRTVLFFSLVLILLFASSCSMFNVENCEMVVENKKNIEIQEVLRERIGQSLEKSGSNLTFEDRLKTYKILAYDCGEHYKAIWTPIQEEGGLVVVGTELVFVIDKSSLKIVASDSR